jgi:hypothetical protein
MTNAVHISLEFACVGVKRRYPVIAVSSFWWQLSSDTEDQKSGVSATGI